MLSTSTDIQPPRTPEDFEDFCLNVYRVELDDSFIMKMGRRGQNQYGLDIISACRRTGIQCKRFYATKLTEGSIEKELQELDAADLGLEQFELVPEKWTPRSLVV